MVDHITCRSVRCEPFRIDPVRDYLDARVHTELPNPLAILVSVAKHNVGLVERPSPERLQVPPEHAFGCRLAKQAA